MTKSDKAKLAEFAGGTSLYYKKVQLYWEFPGGEKIEVARWSPETKPEHGWMVLEAIRKLGYRVQITCWNLVGSYQEKVRIVIYTCSCNGECGVDCERDVVANVEGQYGEALGKVVCQAALETINRRDDG